SSRLLSSRPSRSWRPPWGGWYGGSSWLVSNGEVGNSVEPRAPTGRDESSDGSASPRDDPTAAPGDAPVCSLHRDAVPRVPRGGPVDLDHSPADQTHPGQRDPVAAAPGLPRFPEPRSHRGPDGHGGRPRTRHPRRGDDPDLSAKSCEHPFDEPSREPVY